MAIQKFIVRKLALGVLSRFCTYAETIELEDAILRVRVMYLHAVLLTTPVRMIKCNVSVHKYRQSRSPQYRRSSMLTGASTNHNRVVTGW